MTTRFIFKLVLLLILVIFHGCGLDDVPVPSITSFTPLEGAPGTQVTIKGRNFSPDLSKNTVKILNTELPVDQATETELKVTIPAGAESGEISVIVGGQKTISAKSFIVLGAPFLTSLTPPSGKVGDVISVTGKSFSTTSVNTLTLAGRPIPVTTVSSSLISFTIPPNGKSGDVIVTTSLGVSNALPFKQQMVIESFSPSSGPIGTKVKIKGSGLSASYFPFFSGLNGVAISDTGSELIVAPSRGATSGPISIAENLMGGASVTTTSNFTVTNVPPTLMASYPGVAKAIGMGFAIGTDLYFGLGQDSGISNFYDFWKYSTTNNNWTRVADFPGTGGVTFGASFSIGGKGYIVSGMNPGTPTNKVWQYDPGNNTWNSLPDFPGSPRTSATAFVIGNNAYVGMGTSAGGILNNDFYQFDPVNVIWTRKADFAGGAVYGAVGFTIDGMGYVTGGANSSNGGSTFAEMWSYNPGTNSWRKVTSNIPFQAGYAKSFGFTLNGVGYVIRGSQMWQYIVSTDTSMAKNGTWVEIQSVPDTEGEIKGFCLTDGSKVFLWYGDSRVFRVTPPE